MKKWFRNFVSSGFFIPFLLLLPYVLTLVVNGADKALLLRGPGVEDIVPLVLMVQIKDDYEPETIKAQAVIARSQLYLEIKEGEGKSGGTNEENGMKRDERTVEGSSGDESGGVTVEGSSGDESGGVTVKRSNEEEWEEETIEKINEEKSEISAQLKILAGKLYGVGGTVNLWQFIKWADKMEIYEAAADDTQGQVLVYEGKLKMVPYHAVSNGRTRDGEEVFHSSDFAYLKSVDSSQDIDAPDYINSTYILQEQLPQKLVIKKRDSGGYVTAVTADGKWLEGEAFRYGMHLASSDFSMQKVGKMVRFLCKGKGHGVGFSQYGGNEMAKNGSKWEEILKAYFPEMNVACIDNELDMYN